MIGLLRKVVLTGGFAAVGVLLPAGIAGAVQTPATGQPGASSGVTCFSGQSTASAPGNSMSAPGAVFNPAGESGENYAGNNGTKSFANSNSSAAVSQYDIACLQVTSNH